MLRMCFNNLRSSTRGSTKHAGVLTRIIVMCKPFVEGFVGLYFQVVIILTERWY